VSQPSTARANPLQLTPPSRRRARLVQLVIGLAILATLAGLATMITNEIVMAPTSSERNQLIVLLVALAVVALTISAAMRLFGPRSLTRRLLVSALAGPIVVATAIAAGSRTMFVDSNDLGFMLILLAFATVLAVGVVMTMARPLTEDLASLSEVARRVGDGDLEARAELQRMDEVGDLAASIDSMIDQIAESRRERDASARERSITMASLSHDARTPLTSMRLATEALLDGVAPDPERYLRTIAADIDAVDTLINDLFTIGQLESGRLDMVSVRVDGMDTIEDVVQCLAPIAGAKRVQLRTTGDESFHVIADPVQLHRVLMNVVGNAIRHSPDDAEVTIDVSEPEGRLSVRDAGEGFPPEFVEEAFQPFRRFDEARDRAHGGAGLGLAVSRGIIDALGGRIWADPGPGGAVHLSLPKS
jgi:signal transduction histidine kinase